MPTASAWAPLGGLLTDVGVGFAIWARAVLGRNWSGHVSLKEGHQLMEGGPYALVRHPIYTGLLTALFGTALVRGTLAAFLAVGVFTVYCVSKIHLEERFLASEFGSAFQSYRARVKALIPFVV
ncbi:MAG: methyltransferase family protein [Myxococcaceae bacterium]